MISLKPASSRRLQSPMRHGCALDALHTSREYQRQRRMCTSLMLHITQCSRMALKLYLRFLEHSCLPSEQIKYCRTQPTHAMLQHVYFPCNNQGQ